MKKLLLTIGTVIMILTAAQGQSKIQKLFFYISNGEVIEYLTKGEEEMDETIPGNTKEVFKEAQEEKLIGFDGEVFDLSLISTPEEEIEETSTEEMAKSEKTEKKTDIEKKS